MKLIFILGIVFSVSAFSEECNTQIGDVVVTDSLVISTDVPSHLKGAVIIVRLKNGQESIVPSEKFKVVQRYQQFIVTKIFQNNVTTCKSNAISANRLSGLAGYGNTSHLSSSVNGSVASVESDTGLVLGAQYQRMLNNTISLGIQGQTNKTGSLLLGLDF